MIIAKFRKMPNDRKRYVVDYTDWLDADELLTAVTMEGNVVEDAFYIDGYVIDTTMRLVVFYVAGGVSGVDYLIGVRIDTSKQQIKNDTIQMTVM